VETEDRLGRLVIVEDPESILLQILDVAAMLVGDGENQVNFTDCGVQCEESFVGFRRRIRT
jgi:hypothetical protein